MLTNPQPVLGGPFTILSDLGIAVVVTFRWFRQYVKE